MRAEAMRTASRADAGTEIGRSFPKIPRIKALPGGLYREWKRCNRPTCRCAAGGDALHGPYLYRRWTDGGRLRRRYVKAGDEARVREGIAAWRRQHPPARSAREALAELGRLSRGLEALGW